MKKETTKAKKVRKLFVATIAFICTLAGANIASADTYTPTLDAIKTSEAAYLNGTLTPYNLTTTKGSHTQSVVINGTTYWFTPNAGDKDIVTLSNTGSVALKEVTFSENPVFCDGTKYYSYDVNNLPTSGYTLTEHATKQAGDITIGNKFYSLNLKTTTFGDLSGDTSKNYDTTIPDGKTQNITVKYNSANVHTRVTTFTILDDKIYAFINNSESSEYGGAIYNASSTIGNITANFINNSTPIGGAIYNNNSRIGNITGDFISNSASSYGGAIYNGYNGRIGNITGDFISNSAYNGGAIANGYNGQIGDITGDFISNSASSGRGGAIYNYGTIGNITGDFISNSASYGGAIYNGYNGRIGNITGDFISNSASYGGGAIYNYGTIGDITGDFISNSASSYGGGAMYNESGGQTGNITGGFIGNSASSGRGGAICNYGTIGDITGDFISNSASSYGGGAIYNDFGGQIGNITGDFIGNSASSGRGGAICNGLGTIDSISGSFTDNHVSGNGGAIWTSKDLTFVANNKTNMFKGNYTQNGAAKDYNAIWVDNASNKLTFNAINNGKFEVYDNIKGADGYTVALQGDGTGTFGMYNDMIGANLTLNNIILNTANNTIHAYNFKSITLGDNISIFADTSLLKETMDSIYTTSFINPSDNKITLYPNLPTSTRDILTNPDITLYPIDKAVTGTTRTAFAQAINAVLPDQVTSPIFIYTPLYDNSNGTISVIANSFNPSVLASSVGAQVGAYLTQNEIYQQAFGTMDQTMLMTQKERTAMKFANKYAGVNNGVMSFSPNQIPEESKGMWFRPYASFEKVNLGHGPEVENNSYGMLFGGDSGLIELSHGWDMVWGAYAGYTGSHQNYDGVGIYQNGGTLGLNAAWYKGNFFTGLTANVGASIADADTMYGHENFTMLTTGIASKSGYNWELFNDRFIVQPNFLISYSFVHTFNYTNAAGVNIGSSPLNAIQIVPGLKLIGNLPHGWQPYLNVQMVWNIMDETKFYANDVNLPAMSVDPYIQYGVGLQKRWGERFTGFGQVMFRNGGRTGVALNAGFRFAIGKEASNIDKNLNSSTVPMKKTKIAVSAKTI